jgi:ferritin
VTAQPFIDRLNEQIGHEFAASQQYVANAVFYDHETLPRLARFFYRQALEERDHAMMMVRYLLDSDAAVTIPGTDPPRGDFDDIAEPVALALEQEKRVTDQINELTAIAREEGDFQSEEFMNWFLKEQREEVATMSGLLAVVRRAIDNPLLVEEYLAREHPGAEADDPTAPPVAGREEAGG